MIEILTRALAERAHQIARWEFGPERGEPRITLPRRIGGSRDDGDRGVTTEFRVDGFDFRGPVTYVVTVAEVRSKENQ